MNAAGQRRVLLVDDEPDLVATYAELLESMCEVETADGPERGLERIRMSGPFALVISDLNMPVMNGIEFLARVRALSPDTVRVMLTGCADITAAKDAVNQGSVFRFLTKPCPFEELVGTVEASLAQFAIQQAERELLEKTLAGSVRILTEILSLVNPGAFGRAFRIRRTIRHLADRLEVQEKWQYELAGLLSQIGCVTFSPETLQKVWAGQSLTSQEQAMVASHPDAGAALLENIPRLERVARMIARQDVDSGSEKRNTPEDPDVVLGGEMLRLALALDRKMATGLPFSQALASLRRQTGNQHPGRLLAALDDLVVENVPPVVRTVMLHQLDTSMVLDEDVRARNGLLIVCKGHEVTVPVILRLRAFAAGAGVIEPIRVVVAGGEELPRVA